MDSNVENLDKTCRGCQGVGEVAAPEPVENLSTRRFWGSGDVYKRVSLGKRVPSSRQNPNEVFCKEVFCDGNPFETSLESLKKPL